LVDCWLDLGIGEQISCQLDVEVRYSNASCKFLFDKALHLSPKYMERCLSIPVAGGPVKDVEIKILKLKVLEGDLDGVFWVREVGAPQLGGNKEFFPLYSILKSLLELLSN